jgi:phenylacetate-coenzyme A ligase PaaK-like adenylate-forming protein
MTITDAPCDCGSGHRRITEIRGRLDTLFAYENGTIIHQLAMSSVLLSDPNVVEMQVTQTPNGMEVSLVTNGKCDTAALGEQLIVMMNRSGLVDPDVSIIEVDTLERLWSGKLRQFQQLPR